MEKAITMKSVPHAIEVTKNTTDTQGRLNI